MGNTSERDANKLKRQENRSKIVALRTAGHSYEEIGKILDRGTTWVFKEFKAALKEIPFDAVEHHRAVELARLEAKTKALWPKVEKGSIPAIRTAVTVSARRSALLGLDAPQQVALSGQVAVPISIEEAISKVYGTPAPAAEGSADTPDNEGCG